MKNCKRGRPNAYNYHIHTYDITQEKIDRETKCRPLRKSPYVHNMFDGRGHLHVSGYWSNLPRRRLSGNILNEDNILPFLHIGAPPSRSALQFATLVNIFSNIRKFQLLLAHRAE
jgi:hypothetical protein